MSTTPDPLALALAAAADHERRARAHQEEADRERALRDSWIVAAHGRGGTYRRIAAAVGIAFARVSQIVHAAKS